MPLMRMTTMVVVEERIEQGREDDDLVYGPIDLVVSTFLVFHLC